MGTKVIHYHPSKTDVGQCNLWRKSSVNATSNQKKVTCKRCKSMFPFNKRYVKTQFGHRYIAKKPG